MANRTPLNPLRPPGGVPPSSLDEQQSLSQARSPTPTHLLPSLLTHFSLAYFLLPKQTWKAPTAGCLHMPCILPETSLPDFPQVPAPSTLLTVPSVITLLEENLHSTRLWSLDIIMQSLMPDGVPNTHICEHLKDMAC